MSLGKKTLTMISWRRKKTCKKLGAVPIASMYGIFTYIYHKNQPTVGKYTTHGSYGVAKLLQMHETSSHHSRTICRSFQPTEQPDFNLNYTRLKLNIDTKNDCLENVFQCINFLWIVAGLSISKYIYIYIYILIIEIIYIHIYIYIFNILVEGSRHTNTDKYNKTTSRILHVNLVKLSPTWN